MVLVNALSKQLSQFERIAFAKALWATDQFDPMICAAKLLSKSVPSIEVWTTLVDFLQVVDGWALEDQLAHAAWRCILHEESLLNEVEKWTIHPNFWMRRAALVYTLPYAKAGRNPERMLRWASSYVLDKEWFIQKAIGWWLRVLGEHSPEKVCLFLKEHWNDLKSVARKEATRRLKSDWQTILTSVPK